MKRDRNIQKFFADNRPQADDGRQFMESLRDQIDRLPTPASMTGEEDLAKPDLLRQLRTGVKVEMKRNVLIALGGAVAVFCIIVLLYVFMQNAAISDSGYYDLQIAGKLIHFTKAGLYTIASLILVAAIVLISLPLFSKNEIL